MYNYSANVLWSPEDQSFIATIPELPGLSAFGQNREEAIQNAFEAAQGMVEVMEEDGEKIPEPQTIRSYSGQLRLRLPVSLHESLASCAEKEGLSLNQYIVYLLSVNFTAHDVVSEIRKEHERQKLTLYKVLKAHDTQSNFMGYNDLKDDSFSIASQTKLFATEN